MDVAVGFLHVIETNWYLVPILIFGSATGVIEITQGNPPSTRRVLAKARL